MPCTTDTPCITLSVAGSPALLSATLQVAPATGAHVDNGVQCTSAGVYCPAPVFQSGGASLGTGIDGEVKHFEASATNGIVWAFRYRASSSSAYKWECIGGSPLLGQFYAGVLAQASGTINTLNQFALPLAGEYTLDMESSFSGVGFPDGFYEQQMWARLGGEVEPFLPPPGTVAAAGTWGTQTGASSAGETGTLSFTTKRTVAAAATVVAQRIQAHFTGGTSEAFAAELRAVPIRCA